MPNYITAHEKLCTKPSMRLKITDCVNEKLSTKYVIEDELYAKYSNCYLNGYNICIWMASVFVFEWLLYLYLNGSCILKDICIVPARRLFWPVPRMTASAS